MIEGVIRGKDNQLDLIDPRVRVVQLSVQRRASLIELPCKECDEKMVALYLEELKDLKRQFRKHGVKLTSLSYSKVAKKEATVPRPRIARLNLSSNIKTKRCKGI